MMGVVLSLIYLFLFLWIIKRSKFLQADGIPLNFHYLVMVLKVGGGFAVWAIYTYYYTDRSTSDTFKYFDDAMVVFSALPENPSHYFRLIFGIGMDRQELQVYFDQFVSWHSSYSYGIINDNPTVIRANAIVALFSQGYYAVHIVFMSFISYVGSILIFRFLSDLKSIFRPFLFLSCFLLPTVLLWSNGVMKEPLLIFGLGLLLFSLQQLCNRKWKFIVLFVLASWLMLCIKPYVFLCTLPGMLIYVLISISGTKRWAVKFTALHALLFLIAVKADWFYKPGNLIYILTKKREDFYNVARDQEAGSTISLPEIGRWWEWILHWPEALWIAYFRPHLFEVRGLFYLPGSIENAFFLILIVLYFIRFRKQELIMTPSWFFSLSFVLSMGIIIGSTVPVLGAIVRYKMPALIFLCALCLPALNGVIDKFNLRNKKFLQR